MNELLDELLVEIPVWLQQEVTAHDIHDITY